MATNEWYQYATQFSAPTAAMVPANPESNDAVLVGGALPAIVIAGPYTWEDGVERATIKTDGAHDLAIEAAAGAISFGNAVYINATTGALSNTDSDVFFGYALGAVANAATSIVPVKIGR